MARIISWKQSKSCGAGKVLILVLSIQFAYWTLTSHFLGAFVLLLTEALIIIWVIQKLDTSTYYGRKRHDIKNNFRPFAFTLEESWQEEADIIKSGAKVKDDLQIYPENFPINDTLNNIISLIIRDFVDGWFSHISKNDQTFTNVIRDQFAGITQNLIRRLADVDFTKFVVTTVIPKINGHLECYQLAREIVRNKKNVLETVSINQAIFLNYKGPLHPAIRVGSHDQDMEIRKYLITRVKTILPLLVDKKEVSSPPVAILLREILGNFVLFPVVSMLSDPDFYNQKMVDKLLGVMKDRNDVKRFKTILDRHSLYGSSALQMVSRSKDLQKVYLSLDSDSKRYEKIMVQIRTWKSPIMLKRYHRLVNLQLADLAKAIHVGALSLTTDHRVKEYSERLQSLHATIDILEKKINNQKDSSTERNYSDMSIDAMTASKIADLSVESVIHNSFRISFFMDFMEKRDRSGMVQLYLDVDSLRNPLEDFYIDQNKGEHDDGYLNDDMSQADDIREIFKHHFQNKLLGISQSDYDAVNDFVRTHPDNFQLYVGARKALFAIQSEVLHRMQTTDFPAFKQSDYFIQMIAAGTQIANVDSGDLPENKRTLNGKEANGYPLALYDEERDIQNEASGPQISTNVVNAMEKALGEITKREKSPPLFNFPDDSTNKSSINLDSSAERTSTFMNNRSLNKEQRDSIFGTGDGDESSLFDDNVKKLSPETSITTTGDTGLLSNAIQMDSSLDSLSSSTDDLSTSEVRVAAPGDLDLADEIRTINSGIVRIKQQLQIIDSLLKKAELTRNTSELNILRRSKASLDREIRLKELQKQQYTIQQGENSLYQRSKIRIQSYITSKDKDGKVFVLYIIEVQRLSKENSNLAVAGWMVARRFSQFYKLHKYLKVRYLEVANIAFPKRKVVMKFQQTSLVQNRKADLQKYLRQLVSIQSVCSDRVFRDFLSSDVFTLDSERTKNGSGAKLYNKLWSQLLYLLPNDGHQDTAKKSKYQASSSVSLQKSTSKVEHSPNHHDQQSSFNNLMNNDDLEYGSEEFLQDNSSFAGPLCDLFVTIFQLDKSRAWMGSYTMILILQQLFDSTIEKVIRSNVDGFIKNESNVFSILSSLQNSLWPDNQFRKHSEPRTKLEKDSTSRHAKYLLVNITTDVCSKLFGSQTSRRAANLIFNSYQNELLNRHLVLSIFDEFINLLFPETMPTGATLNNIDANGEGEDTQ